MADHTGTDASDSGELRTGFIVKYRGIPAPGEYRSPDTRPGTGPRTSDTTDSAIVSANSAELRSGPGSPGSHHDLQRRRRTVYPPRWCNPVRSLSHFRSGRIVHRQKNGTALSGSHHDARAGHLLSGRLHEHGSSFSLRLMSTRKQHAF